MELRKDYLLDRWVLISTGREARPKEFVKENPAAPGKICYFCPGSENLTPPEIYSVKNSKAGTNSYWQIRVFDNKFPAVSLDDGEKITESGKKAQVIPAFGKHEIIVETPEHNKQMGNLSVDEIRQVLEVYKLRANALGKIKKIKYVDILKNYGLEGGASLVHTHTQIIAYNRIPTLVKKEIEASKIKGKIKESKGKKRSKEKCGYCAILKDEMKSPRAVFENKSFACFTPFASRFNYEVWIFPKKHVKSILQLNAAQLNDLAECLKLVLAKISKICSSYNFFLHTTPVNLVGAEKKYNDLHFHIEVCPRIAHWAGFELSTDEIINSISPEAAAEFYRG